VVQPVVTGGSTLPRSSSDIASTVGGCEDAKVGYGHDVAWWRKSDPKGVVVLGDPLPVPVSTVDGWTLAGTGLSSIRGDSARELATLLHGIELGVDTPWTYLRAAELLDELGWPRIGLTALDAWLSQPAAKEQPDQTRIIQRQREKLHSRLARESVASSLGEST
jgi:hypothetical protein